MRYSALWLLIVSAACNSDTGFGGTNPPPGGDDDTVDLPGMHVGVGDELAYTIAKTHDPDPQSSETQNEQQVAGTLCIRITDVEDNFAEDATSGIVGDVKAVMNITNQTGTADAA